MNKPKRNKEGQDKETLRWIKNDRSREILSCFSVEEAYFIPAVLQNFQPSQ